MVMGFGCNVPAIMATRTIEDDKDRLVAILVNPYMSCSARLPVFVLFSGAFFQEQAGTVMFCIYMASIMVAFLTAIILSKVFIPGANKTPFIMELPPFRRPTTRSIFIHMFDKAKMFIKKVTSVILVGTTIIWFLQTFPQEVVLSKPYDDQIQALETQPANPQRDAQILALQRERKIETHHERYLGKIGKIAEPVLQPLGFDLNTSIALLTGLVAKEVVVATFGVLYAEDDTVDENSLTLRQKLASSMSPINAIAFMIFTLLYIPCLATIGVMYRETNSLKWTSFSVMFSLFMAWSLAFGVVQVGG